MTLETSSSEQHDDAGENTAASDFARALKLEVDADTQAEPDESGASSDSQHEDAQNAKPETLDDLAKRLNVDPADLYAIKVPRANGEPLTLGALKDRFDEWAGLDAERIAWNEERTQRDNELHLARQELEELLATLPKEHVSQEALQKAASKVQQRIKSERARTLDAIPQWRDEERRTQELTGIANMLKEYGLPENYLSTVYDHRIMRFLRDAHLRMEQVRRALAAIERKPTKQSGASKASGAARKPSNAKSAQRSEDARSELLSTLRDKAGF